jgi:hypothetical protein
LKEEKFGDIQSIFQDPKGFDSLTPWASTRPRNSHGVLLPLGLLKSNRRGQLTYNRSCLLLVSTAKRCFDPDDENHHRSYIIALRLEAVAPAILPLAKGGSSAGARNGQNLVHGQTRAKIEKSYYSNIPRE